MELRMLKNFCLLKTISAPLSKTLPVFLAATTSLMGCTTTLNATKLENSTPAKGIVYYLPETKLEISITRTIKDCSDNLETPKVALLAKAEAITHADVSHKYVVDYETLQSGMKHTDLAFDLYDNGTLKGINVSITDKSGEVLKNLTKIGISIASMVGGVPLPSPAAGLAAAPPKLTCTKLVKDALMELPKALTRLDSKSDELKRQQEVVGQAKTVTDPLSSARLAAELAKRSQIESEYELLANDVENLQNILTKTQKTLVRPTDREPKGLILPDPKLLTDWFKAEPSEDTNKLLAVKWQAVSDFNLYGVTDATEGLVYRQPAPSQFWLCNGGTSSDSCLTPVGDLVAGVKKLFAADVTLPQLGRLARLPLKNGPFQTQTITATFSPDGALTKASYVNHSSFEKASQSVLDSLPSISKFLEDRRTAGIDDLDRETKKVKAQIELEKARKEYENLLNSNQ